MEQKLATINDANSTFSSKKSLMSFLIPSNNKDFLNQKNSLFLINGKKYIIKDNNPKNILLLFISSIFIAISIYFPSYIYFLLSINFDTIIFLFFHSLSIIILIPIIYYFYERINILSLLNYLEHRRWFFLRANLNYLGMFFYIYSLRFFRCITILLTITSLISVIYLFARFLYKKGIISQNLIFGIFCVLTGDSLILYNELKYVNNNGVYFNFIGLVCVIISLVAFSTIKVINAKYLNLDNYNLIVHMMYNNILIFIYNLIFFIISYMKEIKSYLKLISLSLLSGVFFLIGIFTLHILLNNKKPDESETRTIVFRFRPKLEKILLYLYNLNIFYVFFLCFITQSEQIYFKDFVAAIIIFAFKGFNWDKELKDIPCFFN